MRGKKPIFSYKDTWNLDMTLLPIIIEGLKKFRAVESDFLGYPPNLNNFEEWQEVLDFIIESLEAKEPEYNGQFHMGPNHGKVDEDNNEYARWDMKPSNAEEWSHYMNKMKEYGFYRQYAIEHFAKFYFNLWW
jgi:hypothetical protein